MYYFCTKKLSIFYVFFLTTLFFGYSLGFAQNNQNTINPSNMQAIQGLQAINQKSSSANTKAFPENSIPDSDAQATPDTANSEELGQLGKVLLKNAETPNLFKQIDSQNQKLFEEKITVFLKKAEKITLFIFYGLVLFAIISNALMHIIKGASFKSFSIDFLLILSFANFWQILILNWQGAHQNILSFLNNQGFDIDAQRYEDWLTLLFEYTQRVLNLFDYNINQTLVLLAFFLPVLYLWIRWLVLYIATVIQAVVIAQLMVILFAFAPIAPHFVKKPIAYTICSLIKIILLQIMALCFSELVNFYLLQTLDISQLMIMFILIYLLLMLSQHLEKLLDQIFNSTPFLGQFNSWQHDFKQNWQAQLSELTRAIQARNSQNDGGISVNQANPLNRSYEMKQERIPRNENSQNMNPKPPAQFEPNTASYQNKNPNTSQAKSLEGVQKQIWQVKVQNKSAGKMDAAYQERIQKEVQSKKFEVKK